MTYYVTNYTLFSFSTFSAKGIDKTAYICHTAHVVKSVA